MTPLTFHLILHTHWDREWYLPRAAFQARLVGATRELLDLLAHDGNARFVLDGQTIPVEDVLAVHPEWRDRLAAAVVANHLEVGPWYILADELIPSGESLIRNLLTGTADAAALGGRMDVLYSPDAFGHPGILPALAREFGIGAAVAWRGLAPSGPDCDLYRWVAPDGSTVLLHHLPPQGYEAGIDLVANDGRLAERWNALRTQLAARASTAHIAVFVGADHHAPPREVGALRDAIGALEPHHAVTISTLGEYFAAANREASPMADREGELRCSYGHTWTLQGVHATRSRMKRLYGLAERHLLRIGEALAALTAFSGGVDRRGLLRHTRRALLQSQFHDTLCGCCSDLVAREQMVRLTSVHAASREIARSALHDLCRHDPDIARDTPADARPALIIWNPAPRRRTAIMTAEIAVFRCDIFVGPPSGRVPRTAAGPDSFALISQAGDEIPVQILSIRAGLDRVDAARHYPDQDQIDRITVALHVPQIPGLGTGAFTLQPSTLVPPPQGLEVREERIANRYIEVHVGTDGRVDLVDRRNGERYADVLRLFDEPDLGDSYTPWMPADAVSSGALTSVTRSVIADGPLVGAVAVRFTMASAGRGNVSGRLVLIVHADKALLRVRLELENDADDHRLRMCIPVGAGQKATAGAAFGFERREPVVVDNDAYPAEHPVRTAPAQRFVAAAGGERGLAVVAPGFFEYEWTPDREIVLTLLRSTGELSRDTLPSRPGHAGWPMATPDAQERGSHLVEFALAPIHESDVERVDQIEQLWEDTFLALQPTFIRDFTGRLAAAPDAGIELEGDGLVFSAIKPAETGRGLILRCYNTAATPTAGQWNIHAGVSRATLVRADENRIASIELADPHLIPFIAPARGMVTALVYPLG